MAAEGGAERFETILCAVAGEVATITLNRPEALNTIVRRLLANSLTYPGMTKGSAARTASGLVAEIQQRSGLRQAELARRAGIARSVLNAYIRGSREPGVDALMRIATAAGLDVQLAERTAPVDEQRAGKILVQVLELAEALPFRPRAELGYPPLRDLLAARGTG